MSNVTRPRGPLPARVYWVRRFLVLAVAAVLVVGVTWAVGRTGGGTTAARTVGTGTGHRAAPAGAHPGRTTSRVTSTADPRGEPTAASTGTSTTRSARPGRRHGAAPATPLPVATGPCAADDVLVAPKVREPAYAGRRITIALLLRTRTSPACTWHLSGSSVAVKVTSGADRVWSSQDCPAAVPSEDVTVRRDTTTRVAMTWDGRRSDAQCSHVAGWAMPGWYHAETAALGSDPADVQFLLSAPPRRTITPSPHPHRGQPSDGASATDAPSGEATPTATPGAPGASGSGTPSATEPSPTASVD